MAARLLLLLPMMPLLACGGGVTDGQLLWVGGLLAAWPGSMILGLVLVLTAYERRLMGFAVAAGGIALVHVAIAMLLQPQMPGPFITVYLSGGFTGLVMAVVAGTRSVVLRCDPQRPVPTPEQS